MADEAAHFQQAARHVVVVGDQDDAAIFMALDPLGALFGIADRVQRGVVDVDAAGKQLAVPAGRRLQRVAVSRRVDAADQQSLTLSRLEKIERGVDARTPGPRSAR